MAPVEPSGSRGRKAESLVAALFKSGGWQVDARPDRHADGPDLIIRRGGQLFMVEIKGLAEGRADRALPLLALAILQAKAHSREVKGARPLAVLQVGHASPSLSKHVRSFAEQYADGVAVGVVSENGFRIFVGDPIAQLNAEPSGEKSFANPSSRQVVNLFSDLNQWMLKILLAKEIPQDLLSAPRLETRNGAELAFAAGASAMSASRFLLKLRNEGFLDENSQELNLVRRKELLERWRSAAIRPALEVPMRFVLRSPVQAQLRELIANQSGDACLGLFAAAEELKFGHVSGVPTHVFVQKLPQPSDRKWRGLRPASPAEVPDLILRQASFPQSTFRGAVRRDGWSVSDVIQTWLDVASHPARGSEQADLIYEKSLRRIVEQGS